MNAQPTSASPEPSTSSRASESTATPSDATPSDATQKYDFGLSPMAARKLYEQLKKRGSPDAALRVGVRGGGCSGFSYVLEFSDKPPRSRDLVFRFPVDSSSR